MPPEKPFAIAVLASGRGSNLLALIRARQAGALDARVVGVFSDRPDSGAVALARQHGITVAALLPKDFATREDFDDALFDQVEAVQPDLIVCAGYMRLLSTRAVQRAIGRMINIHPSLLPGYPGLHTHARALADGIAMHGASVHCVIPELDAGPVLAQARVAVMPGDTPERLALRVLAREHPLLVKTVRAISDRSLKIDGDSIQWRGTLLRSPLSLNELDELEELS